MINFSIPFSARVQASVRVDSLFIGFSAFLFCFVKKKKMFRILLLLSSSAFFTFQFYVENINTRRESTIFIWQRRRTNYRSLKSRVATTFSCMRFYHIGLHFQIAYLAYYKQSKFFKICNVENACINRKCKLTFSGERTFWKENRQKCFWFFFKTN